MEKVHAKIKFILRKMPPIKTSVTKFAGQHLLIY